jgi:uncharacterized membrane protein
MSWPASLDLWVEYLLRFSHLVAGIAWIGSSFYFIWLDSAFQPPEKPRPRVDGELFMVHGGFYYQVEKRKIFPGELPKVLHWFKWEATLTVLSGYLLMIYLYYLKGATLLLRPDRPLTQLQAIALSLGLIVVGWIFYDNIWHRLKGKVLNILLSALLLVGFVLINFHFFSGRGAFIQTGAMLGTMMLLNVWVRILPGQRKMVADAELGKIPDESFSVKAKVRSVHNTYFIFPVLFIMLSNHYPALYNHFYNWQLLIILALSGALVRHAMVTKNPRERWTLFPAAIGLLFLIYLTATTSAPSASSPNLTPGKAPVSYADIQPILQSRCLSCHSQYPTDEVFTVTAKGLVLETEAQMLSVLPQLHQQVVVGRTMPLLNKTKMTDQERAILNQWILQNFKPL